MVLSALFAQGLQYLTSEQLEDLLHLMLTESYCSQDCEEFVCSMARGAAVGLDIDSATRLLQRAIAGNNTYALEGLCSSFPAVRTLSPAAVQPLLVSALEFTAARANANKGSVRDGMVHTLCRCLPAAEQVDAAAVSGLVAKAVELGPVQSCRDYHRLSCSKTSKRSSSGEVAGSGGGG